MTSRLFVLAVVLFTMAACSNVAVFPGASDAPTMAPTSSKSATSAQTVELTVFGAASLKGALEQATAAYEAAVPGTFVTLSTDSSAALATQIELGAPADVFLSADMTNPQKLVDRGFADGAPVNFARNELTIITPMDNPGGLTMAFDLGKAEIRVVAAGDEVPITKYAIQLVDNLAALHDAPPDFAAAYAANVASKEDNVAAVRTKIELGEGDGAIVYVTDAAASEKVATIDVPDDANVPATYAGVVVRASSQLEAARAFLRWFAGPGGQEILGGLGFLPPS